MRFIVNLIVYRYRLIALVRTRFYTRYTPRFTGVPNEASPVFCSKHRSYTTRFKGVATEGPQGLHGKRHTRVSQERAMDFWTKGHMDFTKSAARVPSEFHTEGRSTFSRTATGFVRPSPHVVLVPPACGTRVADTPIASLQQSSINEPLSAAEPLQRWHLSRTLFPFSRYNHCSWGAYSPLPVLAPSTTSHLEI